MPPTPEGAADEAGLRIGFYVEVLKRQAHAGQNARPEWYWSEAELLERAASDLLRMAAGLRSQARELGQPPLPLSNANGGAKENPVDAIAFKHCFPDVPVGRAAEVVAIYDYLRWLSPSLELHPTVLRQEIVFHLERGAFTVERSLALLRFEEQVHAHARPSLSKGRDWNLDGGLRPRILTLGLVEAARRYGLK
jgi:hypothetical protein